MSLFSQKVLYGKVALVTGAGQGIGAECAKILAEAGARVVCTDIDLGQAINASKLISNDSEAYELDVTNTQQLEELALQLPALDILVCNAGIVTNTPAEVMSDEEWNRVIEINLTGVFKTCRAFGKKMLERQRGSIINIGSMSGQIVNVPQPQCHYNASKAGVHHLTKSLAVEWATRGVRVNAVAPTYIETSLLKELESQKELINRWLDLTPMKRMGKPHEIASIVLFLASEASSLMTGSIINVDAGYTCI